MNNKYTLPTGACHALVLGILEPEAIMGEGEMEIVSDSSAYELETLLKDPFFAFNSLLQQMQ